jgi:putative membrane protein insertion efficiency factor
MTKAFIKLWNIDILNRLLTKLLANLSDFAKTACLVALTFYRGTLSYLFGSCCRFYPTCSEYATQAYKNHGVFKATFLTFLRLCKCHPFGPHGYDPVPDKHAHKGQRL